MFDPFKFWKPKEERKLEHNYQTKLYCENCELQFAVDIVKGITVEKFCEGLSCPKCGCDTVRKSAYGSTYY